MRVAHFWSVLLPRIRFWNPFLTRSFRRLVSLAMTESCQRASARTGPGSSVAFRLCTRVATAGTTQSRTAASAPNLPPANDHGGFDQFRPCVGCTSAHPRDAGVKSTLRSPSVLRLSPVRLTSEFPGLRAQPGHGNSTSFLHRSSKWQRVKLHTQDGDCLQGARVMLRE